jgi:hypothetical protein
MQELSPYRAVNTPPRLYKTNLLLLCKAKVDMSVVISVHNTQTLCENHVESLNIKPGGT